MLCARRNPKGTDYKHITSILLVFPFPSIYMYHIHVHVQAHNIPSLSSCPPSLTNDSSCQDGGVSSKEPDSTAQDGGGGRRGAAATEDTHRSLKKTR